MLSTKQKKETLSKMIEKLELPESAYKKAEERYKEIGEWLCRDESKCKQFAPTIFPQGSFRLGTANHPYKEDEGYDLDLVIKLQIGLTKENTTQEELKILVGKELELYHKKYGIKKALESKHRCWCLEYSDSLKFHMDILPCIPESEENRMLIKEAILFEGRSEELAQSISGLSIAITDDRDPKFNLISDDWKISNPEGYAIWFESQMKLASQYLTERANLFKSASIDDLPSYKWKTPLQTSVQLLKRHRDEWSNEDPDSKPISIIITTLASMAYQGEVDIVESMNNILENMGNFIQPDTPRIPNPSNPMEDFADKWDTAKGRELRLEENFQRWLMQAKIDFELLFNQSNVQYIAEQSLNKYGIRLEKSELARSLGLPLAQEIFIPKETIIPKTKPWSN